MYFLRKTSPSPDPNQISLTMNISTPPAWAESAAPHCLELTPFAQSLPFDPIDHCTPQRRSLPSATAATAATASDPTTPLSTPTCRLSRTRRSPRSPAAAYRQESTPFARRAQQLVKRIARRRAIDERDDERSTSLKTSDRQARRRAIDKKDDERSTSATLGPTQRSPWPPPIARGQRPSHEERDDERKARR